MIHFILHSRPDPAFRSFVTFFNLCGEVVRAGDLMALDGDVSCPLCRLRLAVMRANRISSEGTQAEVIARIEAAMESV